MAARKIQRIYLRTTALIFQRHVNGHEMITVIFLCQGEVSKNHHKGNYERHIGIIVQTLKKNNKASAEKSAPFITYKVDTKVEDSPFPLTFQIFGEIVRENLPLKFPL